MLMPPSIKELPKTEFNVNSGNSLMINCDAMGVPPPSLKWIKLSNPEEILSSSRTLFISNAGPSDSGKYMCLAENSVGSDEIYFNIQTMIPPKIDLFSDKIVEVIAGTNLNLKCFSQAETFPQVSVSWLKNGKNLQSSRVSFNDNGQLLVLNLSEVADQGLYTCIASNTAGSDQKSFDVKILIPPKSDSENQQKLKFTEGSMMTLNCDITAVPLPQIGWFYNDQPLAKNSDTYKIINSGRILQVPFVNINDQGRYKCVGINKAGTLIKNFDVKINEFVKLQGPELNDITIQKGDNLELDCFVQAGGLLNQTIQLNWFINGHLDTKLQNQEVLFVENLQGEDYQDYTCIAENAFSSTRRKFNLNLQYLPVIAGQRTEIIEKLMGSTIRLYCDIRANPIATIFWYLDGQQMTNSHSPILIYKVSKLTQNLTCSAENKIGKATKSFMINAWVKPFFEPAEAEEISILAQENVEIYCNPKGNPIPNTKWMLNNDFMLGENSQILRISNATVGSEGEYSCIAENLGGKATKIFNLKVNKLPIVELPHDNLTLNTGSSLVMPCNLVQGKPNPQVYWSHLGSSSGDILNITSIKVQDMGIYTCVAENEVGKYSVSFYLTVQEKPSIIRDQIPATDIVLRRGDKLELICPSNGFPEPMITWEKDGKVAASSTENSLRYGLVSYLFFYF